MSSFNQMSQKKIAQPSPTPTQTPTSTQQLVKAPQQSVKAPQQSGVVETLNITIRYPEAHTYNEAGKLAIKNDKPILMDYWTDSIEKKVIIGIDTYVNENGESVTEKMLIRNTQEYTSAIGNIFRSGADYVIETENSIYLVDAGIPIKRISQPKNNV